MGIWAHQIRAQRDPIWDPKEGYYYRDIITKYERPSLAICSSEC